MPPAREGGHRRRFPWRALPPGSPARLTCRRLSEKEPEALEDRLGLGATSAHGWFWRGVGGAASVSEEKRPDQDGEGPQPHDPGPETRGQQRRAWDGGGFGSPRAKASGGASRPPTPCSLPRLRNQDAQQSGPPVPTPLSLARAATERPFRGAG